MVEHIHLLVNNPCYLERGRKHSTVTQQPLGGKALITHVTSRGDGNYIYRRCVIADILVNNPCYLERGRKQVMFSILLSFFRLITHVTSRGDGNFCSDIIVLLLNLVNNPCYLERGRKHCRLHMCLILRLVNNPCYLERGRKPFIFSTMCLVNGG